MRRHLLGQRVLIAKLLEAKLILSLPLRSSILIPVDAENFLFKAILVCSRVNHLTTFSLASQTD